MKKKIIIPIIVILLVVVFIVYKVVMLNKYHCDKRDIDTSLIFNETLTINSENSNSTDYITIDNMTISNYFSEYVDTETKTSFKVKYDENGEVESFYSISSLNQYINLLSVKSFEMGTDDDSNSNSYATDKDIKDFLDNHNIKNDIDLFNYIKDNYYFKSNIFTSTKNMKVNYLLNSLVDTTLPSFTSITLINGNIEGYIFKIDTDGKPIKQISILYDDMQYIIVLGGSKVTSDSFIKQLLSSIKFD